MVERTSNLTGMSGYELHVLTECSECGGTVVCFLRVTHYLRPLSHSNTELGQLGLIQIMHSPKAICA